MKNTDEFLCCLRFCCQQPYDFRFNFIKGISMTIKKMFKGLFFELPYLYFTCQKLRLHSAILRFQHNRLRNKCIKLGLIPYSRQNLFEHVGKPTP